MQQLLYKMKIISGFSLFCCLLLTAEAFAKTSSIGAKICQEPGYSCLTVKQGDTWVTLWPNPEQRKLVKYANRMNTRMRVGMTLAVPDNLENITKLDIAPFDRQIEAPGEKLIIFNQSQLAIGMYNPEGELLNWAPASGGKSWCADTESSCRTVEGTFTMYRKGGQGCKSSKYPINKGGGAPMPYCMFFYRGFAIHGSSNVPGYNASHGCIRTFTEEARWINKEFMTLPNAANGEEKTQVIVQ